MANYEHQLLDDFGLADFASLIVVFKASKEKMVLKILQNTSIIKQFLT